MVGWHHRLDGLEFEQVPGYGEGQGSLAFCRQRGHKESDTSERLNLNNNNSTKGKCCFRMGYDMGTPELIVKLLTVSVVIKDNFLLYFSFIFSSYIFKKHALPLTLYKRKNATFKTTLSSYIFNCFITKIIA